MNDLCPACDSKGRPDGRLLCNTCLKTVDEQLVKRWFNCKREVRRAERRNDPVAAPKLFAVTNDVVEQAKQHVNH